MDAVSHRLANLRRRQRRRAPRRSRPRSSGPELRIETRRRHGGRRRRSRRDARRRADAAERTPSRCAAGTRPALRRAARAARAPTWRFDGGIDVPAGARQPRHARRSAGSAASAAAPLTAGDRLIPLQRPSRGAPRTRPRAAGAGVPTGGARLRVLPGPQDDFFAAAAVDALQRTRFTVTPQSNRMGYRLAGARAASSAGRSGR